uniref:Aromatic amino acid beta-eliminating lyase/threonine aldolase domain-containing protein n=1 Tax=Petromyzon marinus TaxID=7757 RepID=S4RTA1_PETMA
QGLGAPVGSVLAGPCELVARARRLRKALGGGMRQAGVVAAAGIVALAGYEETLLADHRHAKMFARAVAEHGAALCTAWPDKVDTNIVMVTVTDPRVTPEMLRQQLLAGDAGGSGTEEADAAVLVGVWSERELRAVFHRDVSHADTLRAAHRFRLVIDNLRAEKILR